MGGAEAVLYEIIKGLGHDEFEHHVIYFHGGAWEEPLRQCGVRLYHVQGALSLYDPVFFVRLYTTIKKIKPRCIHSLLWAANVSSRVAARLLSIPHVSVYHNNIDQDGKLRNWFDKKTRRFSTHLVAVSNEVAQSIIASDSSVTFKDILVIRNGIDGADLLRMGNEQVVSRADVGLKVEDYVIGSVGRFCPVKRYPLLLESCALVFAQFPQARLLLLGTGSEEQLLRDYAQRLGIADKVIFVVGKQAHGYFHLFDCFVQTSDKEGISMALLEAMVHAVPCVVTNTGSEHSVLTHEKDGFIVAAGDVQGISRALGYMITDRVAAQALGQAGQATVEQQFNGRDMVTAYKDLFISCCHF